MVLASILDPASGWLLHLSNIQDTRVCVVCARMGHHVCENVTCVQACVRGVCGRARSCAGVRGSARVVCWLCGRNPISANASKYL
jgi:hypothetical protein